MTTSVTEPAAAVDEPSAELEPGAELGPTGGGGAAAGPEKARHDPGDGAGLLVFVIGGLVVAVVLAWALSRIGGDERAALDGGDDVVLEAPGEPGVDPTPEAAGEGAGVITSEAVDPVEGEQVDSTDDDPAPAQAEDAEPATINDELSLDPITFEVRSATITGSGEAVLDEAAAYLVANPAVTVEIAGHTDSDGDPATNVRLSQARAEAVKAYLEDAGVEGSRMTPVGYGADRPVASNDTTAGKAQNRRIEFIIR